MYTRETNIRKILSDAIIAKYGTISNFTRATKISYSALTEFIKGQKDVYLNTFLRIAEELECDVILDPNQFESKVKVIIKEMENKEDMKDPV